MVFVLLKQIGSEAGLEPMCLTDCVLSKQQTQADGVMQARHFVPCGTAIQIYKEMQLILPNCHAHLYLNQDPEEEKIIASCSIKGGSFMRCCYEVM